jgi:hypothetical protein
VNAWPGYYVAGYVRYVGAAPAAAGLATRKHDKSPESEAPT